MMIKKLSVVLATRNEEGNIGECIKSVRGLADEIIIVDEGSTDKTRSIAESLGAKVHKVEHEAIFHKTKQKALNLATGDWILQLDADERITDKLSDEIKKVMLMSQSELTDYRWKVLSENPLFKRHEKIIEDRDGKIGKNTSEIVAFFVPRINMFLGRPLKFAGVYPDPAIRLVKKDKAWFPAKSVHEIMEIEGEVGWLESAMEHHDSPTLSRYLTRLNRYTDLKAAELKAAKTPKNLIYFFGYSFIVPAFIFLKMYFRHKGFLEGLHGFVWSMFSSLHYPIAYFKYWGGTE